MTSYQSLNEELTQTLQDGGDLNALRSKWTDSVAKISAFVEMFLDRCGNRVLGEKNESPEWKLYINKTDEYNNYTRAIRNVDYFIAKQKLQ
jgi:hypothetical protein